MRPTLTEQEKQQQTVVASYRQGLLWWMGVALLTTLTIPVPFVVLVAGLTGWGAALLYLLVPWYIRRNWSRWYPLGY